MTENNSKYNFFRPSRTEQINRPVTQNSVEKWPENWEEKFCKLRNVWSHHTKLTNKSLRADSSREENISNKKKLFLEYLLQKKEKQQSSTSQHGEEEKEADNKIDSSSENSQGNEESESEEVEVICQDEELSIASTKPSRRLVSGGSKCSELYSKKSVKKCQFDERQYIKDLKNLHSNIQTFLHLSSTYLDKSCCDKRKIEKPYVKKCYLEGYDGPLVVESKKSSLRKTSRTPSKLAFIKMPEHPVKGLLSKKQLEKLSLYNAPNIEVYGGHHKRFRQKRSSLSNCGDVYCPSSGALSNVGSKKSKKLDRNYSYCDNPINLKLNNFNYEQICHQSPQNYRCCACSHLNQENFVQKKGFFKNKSNKKTFRESTEEDSNSDESNISINTYRKKMENKSSERNLKQKRKIENLKSKQPSQKSIKTTKTKQSDHSEISCYRKTKSKKSVKSDKSSKRSTKSSKCPPGILKEYCGEEEMPVKSIKIKKLLSKTSAKTEKSIKPVKSETDKSQKSGKTKNKKPLDEYKITVVCSSTSKKGNAFDNFCVTASKKSSKTRPKIADSCCELDQKSERSLKVQKQPSNLSTKSAKSFKSTKNYDLQKKQSTQSKSNKSIKKIIKKSSSGSYKSATGKELETTDSKFSVKKKKMETDNSSKCVCDGLKRGQNLTPVNPKGLRRKKKYKKQKVKKVEQSDQDDEDSQGEMTLSKAGIFNDKATMFNLVKSPALISSRCTSLFPKQTKNVRCENEEPRKSVVRKQFLKLYRNKMNNALFLQRKQSEKYPKITIKLHNRKYKNKPYRKKSSFHSRTFKKYTKDPNNLLQNPVLRSKKFRPTTDYLLFPIIRKKYGQNNKRVSFVNSRQKNIYCQY